MSYLDDRLEQAAYWGVPSLHSKFKPGAYKRAESYMQSRRKWFGGESRKNGGTGRCAPDRRDHACHMLWRRLGASGGHGISGVRWYGTLSSRKPILHIPHDQQPTKD